MSNFISNLGPSQPDKAQRLTEARDVIEEAPKGELLQPEAAQKPTGNPDEFLPMAYEVNPISGSVHSNQEARVKPATLFPEQSPDQSSGLKELLSPLTNALAQFWGGGRIPVVALALFLVPLPLIILTLSLLSVINSIPLAPPIFKLIGITYSAWFIYRYLLFDSKRQELSALKQKLLGGAKVNQNS